MKCSSCEKDRAHLRCSCNPYALMRSAQSRACNYKIGHAEPQVNQQTSQKCQGLQDTQEIKYNQQTEIKQGED